MKYFNYVVLFSSMLLPLGGEAAEHLAARPPVLSASAVDVYTFHNLSGRNGVTPQGG